jgi:4-azaleucine resistance transporter AzlC
MKDELQEAFKAGIPIFIGYAPAAAAFGILAKGVGISLLECFLFSALVFAGASQFIALNLLVTGMGPAGIVLTTLLVNFRHFLMSSYLATRVRHIARKYHFLVAFGVTDEVFSVLSLRNRPLTRSYIFILQISAYSAWLSGTVAGYILGGFLPEELTQSMGVALYALLLAILLPEMKRSAKIALLAICSGLLNYFILQLDLLPDGWSIIVCILVVAGAGSFIMTGNQGEEAHG